MGGECELKNVQALGGHLPDDKMSGTPTLSLLGASLCCGSGLREPVIGYDLRD